MKRHGVSNILLPACILLLAMAVVISCGRNQGRRPKKPVPVKFRAEELAEGFVVTRLMGSTTVRLADNIEFEPPPYEFYLTLTNPAAQPRTVVFIEDNPTDLAILQGEIELFRYSELRPGKKRPAPVEIRAKGKYSWPLKWDGRLEDGEFLDEGVYTLVFTLNTEPPNTLIFEGVKLKFPDYGESESEEEASGGKKSEDEGDKPFPFGLVIKR